MPIAIRIDRRILVFEAAGGYSREELEAAFLTALARPDATGLAGVLLDLRESDSIVTRTADELRNSAAFYSRQAERVGGRVAILTSSAAAFGLGRMASVTAEQQGLKVLVCRDVDEAWHFLLTS